MKRFLLGLWSLLPFLALTEKPGYFGGEDGYCFSLVNLLLGEMNIQICSFSVGRRGAKICWYKKTTLSKQERFILTEQKSNQLLEKYRKHLCALKPEDRTIEKDELLRKLSREKSRIDTSYNKINGFTAIFLAIIPLVSSLKDAVLRNDFFLWIAFLILLYVVLNVFSFFFQASGVRGIVLSSFADVKNSHQKEIEQLMSIYFDWQQTKRKADLFVSYVSYAQKWVESVIVWASIFQIALTINSNAFYKVDSDENTYVIQADRITETYDAAAIDWSKVIYDLETDSPARVVISFKNANLSKIKQELSQFHNQEFVWLKDETLEDNVVRIVLED